MTKIFLATAATLALGTVAALAPNTASAGGYDHSSYSNSYQSYDHQSYDVQTENCEPEYNAYETSKSHVYIAHQEQYHRSDYAPQRHYNSYSRAGYGD